MKPNPENWIPATAAASSSLLPVPAKLPNRAEDMEGLIGAVWAAHDEWERLDARNQLSGECDYAEWLADAVLNHLRAGLPVGRQLERVFCMSCGKADCPEKDKCIHVPGPAVGPRYWSCCGAKFFSGIKDLHGPHKSDCVASLPVGESTHSMRELGEKHGFPPVPKEQQERNVEQEGIEGDRSDWCCALVADCDCSRCKPRCTLTGHLCGTDTVDATRGNCPDPANKYHCAGLPVRESTPKGTNHETVPPINALVPANAHPGNTGDAQGSERVGESTRDKVQYEPLHRIVLGDRPQYVLNHCPDVTFSLASDGPTLIIRRRANADTELGLVESREPLPPK